MNEDISLKLKEALRKARELVPYAPNDFIRNELELGIKDLMTAISLVETAVLDEQALEDLNATVLIIDQLHNKHASN
jgi:hypothetical protein